MKKYKSNGSYKKFSARKKQGAKMTDLHKTADAVLEAMRTIPRSEKFSENIGNWIPLDNLEKHIHKNRKQTKLYIDNQTFLLAIGVLTGAGKIECTEAHGRGVGYFFIAREKKHEEQ